MGAAHLSRSAVSRVVGRLKKLFETWGERDLQQPLLLVSDGHPGLAKALECWPEAKVQRSTVHKLRNLLKHCPPHAHLELKRDYYPIVYARDGLKAREDYDAFLTRWSRLCRPAARSLEEAGLRLLTFYEFPRAMWKSLRSTSTLENLNREFRRRTKTQASFSS